MPITIPALPAAFFQRIPELFIQEIAVQVTRLFTEETIPSETLSDIAKTAFSFPVPLVQLSNDTYVLELFHGPTLAFKDFGAQYMAGLLSYYLQDSNRYTTVLVATSGDTGGAVAHAFYRKQGIRVVLLYPSGQVSRIQESQMATLGENIVALEVSGTFDDCQSLVKQAFRDQEVTSQLRFVSANSINIARLIPQSFYYFYAHGRLPRSARVVFSVPSGNFGNLTAGLLAKRMGLPVDRFIAATNMNDTVPAYLDSGIFNPRASQRTLSNAMDVGNPSNFARILALYGSDFDRIKKDIWGERFTDDQTRAAIQELAMDYGYTGDPHTAIAYLGWKNFPKQRSQQGVFLSTAHPAKFDEEARIPDRLLECLNKPKKSMRIPNDYPHLKEILLTP
jgi:threonine synthase